MFYLFIFLLIMNLYPQQATATEVSSSLSNADSGIIYTVSMNEPHTHYFEVSIQVPVLDNTEYTEFKLPVWTPGSYLVREFSRKIESVNANNEQQKSLSVKKINKNTWRVSNKNATQIVLSYRVYSFEASVRTSFLDDTHATINAASLCMYVAGHQKSPIKIRVQPYKTWKIVSTALPAVANEPHTFSATDYDLLVDSPIEVGNHQVVKFMAANVPHELLMVGPHNGDEQTMVKDIQKIVEEQVKIFNDHPCSNYTILQTNTEAMYGGLEHLNSTHLMYPRWDYQPASKYQRWLGLMSHEYFHLWNVKRLRPFALGPFNYEEENYTEMLWVAEGITSYYDDLVLRRADLMTEEQYLNVVADNINKVENNAGSKVEAVTQSSFDAWIKYYRPDENSENCCTNYYVHGAVLGTLLDLAILHHTKGQKKLDDVMRYMYEEYYKKQQRGFHDEEFQQAVEKIAGVSMTDFFQNHVSGTKTVDYNQYFGYVGLQLKNTNSKPTTDLGIKTKADGNRLVIVTVLRGGCGYSGGLSANDELLAIDNFRITNDAQLRTYLDTKKNGAEVDVLVSRNGMLTTVRIKLQNNSRFAGMLEALPNPTTAQKQLYKRWLSLQ
jgi:predicted metalloprotease with PDZ domain